MQCRLAWASALSKYTRKFTSNDHCEISFNRVESTALPSFRTIYNRITGTRIVVRISACTSNPFSDEMRITDQIKGSNPTNGFPENALKPQLVTWDPGIRCAKQVHSNLSSLHDNVVSGRNDVHSASLCVDEDI